jgi:hypothetical protein
MLIDHQQAKQQSELDAQGGGTGPVSGEGAAASSTTIDDDDDNDVEEVPVVSKYFI